MHARHRSPGNGYRSNSMGMTTGSRTSPEGSMRSHGFYNSEYRSFNRSYGRNHGHSQPKSFQPPQPPLPRRGDIFMEAGRLAAEYLVSQGLLPPSALSGKWQNGSSFKKQIGDFQDYRSQEGDGVQFPSESRISGHSRLGDANVDGGSGRRRYSDDYGTGGWRNNMKGKRRGGSFRGNNSDWGRDYGRSSSWSDRHRASPDYSNNSRHREEPVFKEDAMILDKSSMDVSTKNDDAGDAKPKASENEVKESSQLPNADHRNETDGEVINECDDSNNLKEKTGEMKDSSDTTETVKVIVVEEIPPQQCTTKNKSFDKDDVDLRTLCKFANVPTRMRSSLASRATKVDQVFGGEENSSTTVPSRGSEIVGEEDTLASTSNFVSSTHNDESKTSVPENSKEPDVEPIDDTERLSPVRAYEQHEQVSSPLLPDTGKSSPTCSVDQGICLNTSSFPEKTTMSENDKEASADLQNFGTLSSLVEKRGEKRDFEDNDVKEGNKRSREWLSSMVGNMDDFFRVSNSTKGENDIGEGNTTNNKPSIETADQKSSASTSQLSGVGDKPCGGYMQEKQFFPGSFKICDLNLMGTSEINENHEGEPVFMYPSIPEFKQEAGAVDIDLSISNSSSSLGCSRQVADSREIEIIDLENDSGTEDKAFEPERKMETTYTGMEGFSNPPQNVADIPDGQENYGLMISELLANDYSNCAAVPDEINPLDNMVLHNGEGTLADDDSIYMSLGEIPLLGFMRNWEQPPPQEDSKPF